MQISKPKLLGFGLIVLVLAWYGFTRPDAANEAVPVRDGTAHAEQAPAEAATGAPARTQTPAASIVETALPGNAASLPEEDVECLQPPPPPSSNPLLDGRLESEPVDQGWAIQTESLIWSIAATMGEVKSVMCRTSFCVATLAYGATVRDLDPVTRRAQARNKVNYLDDTMRAFIASSNSRLGHYACRSVGAPFEGFEFEFYVYGPPRAVAE